MFVNVYEPFNLAHVTYFNSTQKDIYNLFVIPPKWIKSKYILCMFSSIDDS